MFGSIYERKNIVISLLLMGVMLSGCTLFKKGPSLTAFETSTMSPQGVRAEDFLSDELFVLMEFNLANENQKAAWTDLMNYFPSKDQDLSSLEEKMEDSLDSQLAKFDLSYEEDVKPILDLQGRMVFAGGMKDMETMMYFVMTMKDVEAFDSLLANFDEKETLMVLDHNGEKVLFDNESDLYLTKVQDLLVIGKGLDDGKMLLDRSKEKKNILAKSDIYQGQISRLSVERFGFLYLDVKKAMYSISSVSQTEEDVSDEGSNQLVEKILSEGLTLEARKDGLVLAGIVLGDSDSDLDLKQFVAVNELYKVVPGQDLIAYMEAFSLKRFFETNIENAMISNSGFAATYAQIKQQIKDVAGMDLEEDILSWMGGNYAVALHSNKENVMPGVSFFIKSTDGQKSKQFVRLVQAQLNMLINLVKTSEPVWMTVIEENEVEVDNGTLQKITVDFSNIPDTEANELQLMIPESVRNQKVVLQYGVVGEDIFVISAYQDLAETYGDGLTKNDEYKKIAQKVDGYDEGLVFLDVHGFIDYVLTMINFTAVVRGEELSAEEMEGLDELKKITDPIKSLILSSKMQEKEGAFQGFVSIGE